MTRNLTRQPVCKTMMQTRCAVSIKTSKNNITRNTSHPYVFVKDVCVGKLEVGPTNGGSREVDPKSQQRFVVGRLTSRICSREFVMVFVLRRSLHATVMRIH